MDTDTNPPTTPSEPEPLDTVALKKRLQSCVERVSRMCRDGKPPKMRIPATTDDDDVFIIDTIGAVSRALDELDRRGEELARLECVLAAINLDGIISTDRIRELMGMSTDEVRAMFNRASDNYSKEYADGLGVAEGTTIGMLCAENAELRAELTRLRSAPAQGGRDGDTAWCESLAAWFDSLEHFAAGEEARSIATRLREASPTPRDPVEGWSIDTLAGKLTTYDQVFGYICKLETDLRAIQALAEEK